MKGTPEILIVADSSLGEELTTRIGDGGLASSVEPYDALMEMSRRSWPVIVITAPGNDLAGLCRASRRLQRDSRVFAVCSPPAEPEARKLLGEAIDDYFIYPISRDELQRICDSIFAERSAANGTTPGGILLRDLTTLLNAARNTASLESELAEMVSSRIGRNVEWLDVDKLPEGSKPLLLASEDALRILAAPTDIEELSQPQRQFIESLEVITPALVTVAKRTESLHRLAISDHLTGAYNRRYFYHLTDQILLRARQGRFRVTLLLYDIDNFKRYNDTYGHAAGDEILRETASLMRRITRNQDIVARIGGDEFAVLFWDNQPPRTPDSKPPESAYVLADRFRQAVARHEFPSLGPEAKGALTISGGLAMFPADGKTCRELLRKADMALKEVKKTGKNAIRLIWATKTDDNRI